MTENSRNEKNLENFDSPGLIIEKEQNENELQHNMYHVIPKNLNCQQDYYEIRAQKIGF